MKFEVNIPVRKNLFKQKENKMENNETINANEMVKNGKTAVHPEVILFGAAAVFYIGYQTGKSHQLNELLRASMGVQ